MPYRLATSPCSNVRSQNPEKKEIGMGWVKGFEPPTYCLEGSCSIQLSYWRMQQKTQNAPSIVFMERVMGIEPTPTAWKAVVLAVILHPQVLSPFSHKILPYQLPLVKRFFLILAFL